MPRRADRTGSAPRPGWQVLGRGDEAQNEYAGFTCVHSPAFEAFSGSEPAGGPAEPVAVDPPAVADGRGDGLGDAPASYVVPLGQSVPMTNVSPVPERCSALAGRPRGFASARASPRFPRPYGRPARVV